MTKQSLSLLFFAFAFGLMVGWMTERPGSTPRHPSYGITAQESVRAQALVFSDTPVLTPCEQLAILEAWTLFKRGSLSTRQMLELTALISRSACERRKREIQRGAR